MSRTKRQTIKITSAKNGVNETIQREELLQFGKEHVENLKSEFFNTDNKLTSIPVGFDGGNLNRKVTTMRRSTIALSSHVEISAQEYTDLKQYDEYAPHIYTVQDITDKKNPLDPKYFVTGEASQRLGANLLIGNSRYISGVYDVQCAIGIYDTIDADKANINLMLSYPPKDKFFKPLLIDMMKGKRYKVTYNNHTKEINIETAHGTTEAQAGFIDATVDMSGLKYKGDSAIRKGLTLLIDVGGYTTDIQLFENGLPIKDTDRSETTGIIHILSKLDEYLRQKYPKQLQELGIQQFMRHELIEALTKGFFRKGQSDKLDCSTRSNELIQTLIGVIERKVLELNQGTIKAMDNILLVNGGSYVIKDKFVKHTKHSNIFINSNDPKYMVFGTAHGLLKKAKVMQLEGKLK